MDPHEQVTFVLLEARGRGWTFAAAWLAALQSLPRPKLKPAKDEMAEWLEALAWARPFYLAAYDGLPFAGTPPLEDAVRPPLDAVA